MAVRLWFAKEHWFSLPLKLRVRWWHETDYGRLEPSDELLAAVGLKKK